MIKVQEVFKENLTLRRRNTRLRNEVLTLRELIDKWDYVSEELVEEELKIMEKERDE